MNIDDLMLSVLKDFDKRQGINMDERFSATNINRVIADLLDLPYKPGYSTSFKITVIEELPEPFKWLLLRASFIGSRGNLMGKKIDGWLVMLGYPKFPPALKLDIRPPCPDHPGGHPHVYSDGTLCWQTLTQQWSEGCDIYSDYIVTVLEILNNPTEHILCGGRL